MRVVKRVGAIGAIGLIASTLVVSLGGSVEAKMHPGSEVTKTTTFTAATGKAVGGRVACPSGDRVIGGGSYWHRQNHIGDPSLFTAVVRSSSPTADGKGWYASGLNGVSETLYLTITA